MKVSQLKSWRKADNEIEGFLVDGNRLTLKYDGSNVILTLWSCRALRNIKTWANEAINSCKYSIEANELNNNLLFRGE